MLCAMFLVVLPASAAGDVVPAGNDSAVVQDTLVCPHPAPVHLVARPARVAEAAACPVDSIVGYDDNGNITSSTLYEYDAAGNTLAEVRYLWTGGGKTGVSRYRKYYTGSTATTTVNYQWDASAHAWAGRDSTVLLYDGNTNTGSVFYVMENGAWRVQTLYEYEYNAAGTRTLSRYSKWNAAAGALEFVEKYEWDFDAAGNQTKSLYWLYKDGQWVGSKGTIAAYDANKKKTLEEKYSGWENGGWKGTSKNTYVYNTAKQLTEQVTYTWSGGWVEKTKVTKDYSGSNITDNASYAWKNGAWFGTSRTTKTYTGSLVLTATAWAWEEAGAEWLPVRLDEYTYSGSKVLTCTTSLMSDGNRVYVSKLENTYNASSRIERETTLAWRDGDWADSIYTAYEYSAKGVNTLKVSMKKEGSLWQATDSMTHEITYALINGKEYTLSDLQQQWTAAAGIWTGISRSESQYDEAGNLLQADTYSFIGGKWVNNTRRQYAYKDQKSNLRTLEMNMTWDNKKQQWTGNSKYEYGYDDTDRKTINITYKWNNPHADWEGVSKSEEIYEGKVKTAMYAYKWDAAAWDWTGMFHYNYTYDGAGRTVEQLVQSYDAVAGVYVNDTRNEYGFDEKNRQVRSDVYKWMRDAGEWCLHTKDEMAYDSDTEGKLRYHLNSSWSNCELTYYDKEWYHYSCDLKYYTVRFLDWDGRELQSGSLLEGTMPEYSGNGPERAADEQYTYTFSGWDKELSAVSGDASYTAVYSTTLNQYTVTFYDEDGTTVLWSSSFDYGTVPVYGGEKIEKVADEQYSYAFAGWDKEISAVSGDASYTAVYSTTLNRYTVTFYDEDGETVLWSETLDYGTLPVYKGEKPVKEGNQHYSYSFIGWDNEIVALTGNTSYTAVFMESVNMFTVTFRDADGVTELQSQNYEYGQLPEYAGETPTKTGDAQYSYVFDGWDKAIVPVTEYTVYTAQYKEVVNRYVVTFYDEDGTTVLWSDKFDYGAMAAYGGETPATTGDAQYSHVFKGWDKELAEVTGDASYTAQYEDVLNLYRVTFYDEDGETVLDSREWEYGSTPAYMGTTPVKAEDENNTYSFSGWDKEITAVTGETSYRASYTAIPKTPTALDGVQEAEQGAVKVVENGAVYIIRGGIKYNTAGGRFGN